MNAESEVVPFTIRGLAWEMIKTFALAIIIIIPIRLFLFQPFFVDGESMEPSFHNGEYLIVYEHGYKQVDLFEWSLAKPKKEFSRGEIVVFHPPGNEKQYYIKRVIGLPGESIAIIGGQVVLYNTLHPEGQILAEEYVAEGAELIEMPKKNLTKDEYFVMGDNRMFSFDSRQFGPIKKEMVIGKVLVRAWPPTSIGIL
jgi:signal peptidase I